jgi:hypothetical protein
MDHVTCESNSEAEGTDRSAIIMMLTYVEAECRRLGDTEAARLAAQAAALIIGGEAAPAAGRRLPRRLILAAPLN